MVLTKFLIFYQRFLKAEIFDKFNQENAQIKYCKIYDKNILVRILNHNGQKHVACMTCVKSEKRLILLRRKCV